MRAIACLSFSILLSVSCARAHDVALDSLPPAERDAWIEIGARVHGGFGSLIAVGIRIGHDALHTLNAKPRQLDVTYYSGAQAPCPCIVDGIMVVTAASPGQNSLRVAAEPAGPDEFGKAVIRNKSTGMSVEYAIPVGSGPVFRDLNKLPVVARWDGIMKAPEQTIFVRSERRP
jgi:hypothetical protein